MNKKVLLLTSLLAVSCLASCGSNKQPSSATPTSKKPQDNGIPSEMIIPEAEGNPDVTNPAKSYPDELLLNHRVATLLVDEEYKIEPIEQFNYSPDLSFTVKDATVASVTDEGVLKGLKAGETELLVADKENPDLSYTVPVFVSPEITLDEAKTLADTLGHIDETNLNRIVDLEMYEKRIYKNGALVSYDRYDQRMTVSEPDAYFRIWETDAEMRVENGGVDFTNYEWIFYTNPFYDTYIYHQTGDVKNYFPVATQSYMEKDRTEPLLDILDNLFVSGKEIFTNSFKNAKLGGFTDMVGAGYSNVSDEYFGSLGDGQMIYGCTVLFNDETADQDTESRYGIPYGTPTPATQAMRYAVKDNRVMALAIHLEETYTIGEDNYVEIYDIDHMYEEWTNDAVYVPNKKDYTLVDSLFSI